MKRNIIFLCLLFFLHINSQAQGIKGHISDTKLNSIPYANIFVSELGGGTTSNADGNYNLNLPNGTWEVAFRYMGYQTTKQTITVNNNTQEVNITLKAQSLQLPEVTVLASGEDPAYYIMRRAISLAPYYAKQVESYHCKVYVKGSGYMRKIPLVFKKKIENEGLKVGKTYISESINTVHFELPNKLKQETQAVRTSVVNDLFSSITMPMINLTLYDDWNDLKLSDYSVSIVSPLNRNALRTYNFKLIGSFYDQGQLINQIQVTPKVKGKNKFSGTLNIIDKYWSIYSVDMNFSVPFAQIKMKQTYSEIKKNVWMPTSTEFKVDGEAMGFNGHADYIASISDYNIQLNKQLDHSFLAQIDAEQVIEKQIIASSQEERQNKTSESNKPNSSTELSKSKQKIAELQEKESLSNREMYKMQRLISKEAQQAMPNHSLELTPPLNIVVKDVKNDSAYWNKLRPVPLTSTEQNGFALKDSLSNTPKDSSLTQSSGSSKYTFSNFLSGKTIIYGNKHTLSRGYYNLSGLFNLSELSYNTVDGIRYGLPFEFNSLDTLGRTFHANAKIAYGFSSKNLYGTGNINYQWNGLKQQGVSLEGGRTNTDFNTNGIRSLENSIYSLLLENNAQKFYLNNFIQASFYSEITNGLLFKTSLKYANRKGMQNNSNFTIINWNNRELTENTLPFYNTSDWQNSSFTIHTSLSYTPQQYYRIYKKQKIASHSKYPTFKLDYERAMPKILNTDSRYDFIQLGISQKIEVGLNDLLTYQITSGSYFNSKQLDAPNLSYAQTNNEFIALNSSLTQFYTPSYYSLYSGKQFAEAHIQLISDKLLLKHLPLLNRSLLTESIRLHYYTSESVKQYFEVGYGLSNIFMILDLSVNYGSENWQQNYWTIRLGVQF